MCIVRYATGHEINENSALIHDFYIRESGDLPVHVTVDLQRENVRVVVSGHVGISLTLGQTVGSLFYPIEATISGDETEKLACKQHRLIVVLTIIVCSCG